MNGFDIGSKYGESISNFGTDTKNVLESALKLWCNGVIGVMRKTIRAKARTGSASTLAQSIALEPITASNGVITATITSSAEYNDYVDKGVRGVKMNKAPKSKYKFKTIGASPKMINSFKKYIAATGSISMKGKKLIRKNKKTQADLITQEAKAMAVATKIGGIKPMNYKATALNAKAKKELKDTISKNMKQVITITITQ